MGLFREFIGFGKGLIQGLSLRGRVLGDMVLIVSRY